MTTLMEQFEDLQQAVLDESAADVASKLFSDWAKLNIVGTSGGKGHLVDGGEHLEFQTNDAKDAARVQKAIMGSLKKHGFKVKQGRRGTDAFNEADKVLVRVSDVKRIYSPEQYAIRIWVYTPGERFYSKYKKQAGF